ncbi:MAG: AAA family ATPase [Anaerolineaceae bacterium]
MTNESIQVVGNDETTVKWLSTFLSMNGYNVRTAGSGHEGLEKITTEHPELVILDLHNADLSNENVLYSIIHNPITTNIPVIVFMGMENLLEIANVFNKGATECIIKRPGIESELLAKCTFSLNQNKRSTKLNLKGSLVSFYSAKGGTGTSTLCLNLAHMLAGQVAPQKVLVVDMVIPLGSLAIMTGSHPEKSIVGLTTEDRSYNEINLRNNLSPIEGWNFSFIESSRNPHDAGVLIQEQIRPLFNSLSNIFNYVFVDLGKALSRISMPLMHDSESIVIVMTPDHITVELTNAALNFLKESGIHENNIFLVLNRIRKLGGLSKIEIEKRFKMPIQGTVPYGHDKYTLSSNQNLPHALRFPDDAANYTLSDLVTLLLKRSQRIKIC